MINPLRSEEDAFRFTVIVVVLVAPVIVTAIVFSSGAALGVAGGIALGVLIGLFVLKKDEPEEKLLLGRPREGGEGAGRRILVVANETLTGHALRREIEHRAGDGGGEVRVVCPALNTKIKHWVSDEDDARRQAQERLNAVVEALEGQGLHVEGTIGDDDPVQAIEDALRVFPAEEAIISTHPPGRSNWLERDVVERARARFDIPIAHVIVDLEHERGPVTRT
jgi:GABA permease